MNKFVIISFVTLFLGAACSGQHYSDAHIASASEAKIVPGMPGADTLFMNPKASEIAWKGTKMWGRGMHTGIVPVKKGYLLFKDDRLVGGTINADMTAIGITDIPPDQPEPIRILTGHLEDEVFFDAENYSEASFELTDINFITERTLNITGNLTIKGISKSISFPAETGSSGRVFTARFRIDRFEWNIAYTGGFGKDFFSPRNFVDRYIELSIKLVPKTAEQNPSVSGFNQQDRD